MSSENKNYNTQVIVALIGVVGVLGAGLFANWDKIFPPTPANVAAPAVSTGNSQPVVAVPPVAVTPPVNQAGPAPSPVVGNAQPQFFNGTYVGVSTEGLIQSQFQVTFQRHGNTVTGTYFQNGMQGTIQGTVNGNTMHYQWSLGGYSGRAVCTIQGNKVTGVWGYGISENNGGTTVSYLQ